MYKLYNDNCMNLLNSLEDDSIDCIITSPPYNKSYFNKNRKNNSVNDIWKHKIDYSKYEDNLPIEEYEDWMVNFINLCLKKLKPNGSFFFNHKPIRYNNKVYFPLNFILKSKIDVYQEIIWNRLSTPNVYADYLLPCTERIYWIGKGKPKSFRNRLESDYVSEVWNITAEKNNFHPAPFPKKLVDNCLLLTTEENDLVLDPFSGSGTTGIECMKLHRNFIGIELDENYYKISEERIKEASLAIDDIF